MVRRKAVARKQMVHPRAGALSEVEESEGDANTQLKNEAARAQYDSYLEDLCQRGLISSTQKLDLQQAGSLNTHLENTGEKAVFASQSGNNESGSSSTGPAVIPAAFEVSPITQLSEEVCKSKSPTGTPNNLPRREGTTRTEEVPIKAQHGESVNLPHPVTTDPALVNAALAPRTVQPSCSVQVSNSIPPNSYTNPTTTPQSLRWTTPITEDKNGPVHPCVNRNDCASTVLQEPVSKSAPTFEGQQVGVKEAAKAWVDVNDSLRVSRNRLRSKQLEYEVELEHENPLESGMRRAKSDAELAWIKEVNTEKKLHHAESLYQAATDNADIARSNLIREADYDRAKRCISELVKFRRQTEVHAKEVLRLKNDVELASKVRKTAEAAIKYWEDCGRGLGGPQNVVKAASALSSMGGERTDRELFTRVNLENKMKSPEESLAQEKRQEALLKAHLITLNAVQKNQKHGQPISEMATLKPSPSNQSFPSWTLQQMVAPHREQTVQAQNTHISALSWTHGSYAPALIPRSTTFEITGDISQAQSRTASAIEKSVNRFVPMTDPACPQIQAAQPYRFDKDIRQVAAGENDGKLAFDQQQEALCKEGPRGQEIAAYRKKKRQAKEMAKLEHQTNNERNIVSAAIEAVINETSNTTPTPLVEGIMTPSHNPHGTQGTKGNAFSMMMGKSKMGPKLLAPLDFTHCIGKYEAALTSVDCNSMSEREFQKFISKAIATCVQRDILVHNNNREQFQTRMNAMYAVLEIALAVAYAPRNATSDGLRNGSTPGYLCVSLYFIADRMSEAEAMRVLKDQIFMGDLKKLRTDPMLSWEGDTWNGLDEVLRVLKDPGPVNFRRVYKNVTEAVVNGTITAAIRGIRRDITDYISHDTCFETKYNALNVLADVGVDFVERNIYCSWEDSILLIETLCTAMLKISQMLKQTEVERVIEELRMDDALPSSDVAHKLDHQLIPGSRSVAHVSIERGAIARSAIFHTTKKTPEYAEQGLLVKLLHIRWHEPELGDKWKSSTLPLEQILGIFVDVFKPIYPGEYLEKLNQNFARELANCSTANLRVSVDRSIEQLARRSTNKATFDSRLNAFRILVNIGLKLVGFLDPRKPFWQTRIFKDEVTDENLMEAMRSVCHSLVKENKSKVFADEELINDLISLNSQRLALPDAMLGLDAVMALVGHSGELDKGTNRKRKAADVVDLTDASIPTKRAIPATTATITIDLTGD